MLPSVIGISQKFKLRKNMVEKAPIFSDWVFLNENGEKNALQLYALGANNIILKRNLLGLYFIFTFFFLNSLNSTPFLVCAGSVM